MSERERCGSELPHGRHEWISGAMRRDCPGLAARGRDRTAWPTTDGDGNNLRHTELCAWRYGGECDCGEPRSRGEIQCDTCLLWTPLRSRRCVHCGTRQW